MKIYALLVVLTVALAGCSSSLKGSVGSVDNQDAAKNGSYVASNTGTNHSGSVVDK
jgi:PBP1b-binding outer membrane lipoprotein LpoB